VDLVRLYDPRVAVLAQPATELPGEHHHGSVGVVRQVALPVDVLPEPAVIEGRDVLRVHPVDARDLGTRGNPEDVGRSRRDEDVGIEVEDLVVDVVALFQELEAVHCGTRGTA
jgi:hypothetical protein